MHVPKGLEYNETQGVLNNNRYYYRVKSSIARFVLFLTQHYQTLMLILFHTVFQLITKPFDLSITVLALNLLLYKLLTLKAIPWTPS